MQTSKGKGFGSATRDGGKTIYTNPEIKQAMDTAREEGRKSARVEALRILVKVLTHAKVQEKLEAVWELWVAGINGVQRRNDYRCDFEGKEAEARSLQAHDDLLTKEVERMGRRLEIFSQFTRDKECDPDIKGALKAWLLKSLG